MNSRNLLAESYSVENNIENPLLFDERIIKKKEDLSTQILKFNFESQIKANPYDLKDLNSSLNASVNTDKEGVKYL